MTLGVRAAVLNAAGEVFLVRHTYVAGWHLPGGGVEVGETLEQALAKELREEGSIRLSGPAVLHGVFFNRAMSRRDHVAVFVVRDFVQDGVRQPDREIAEAGFFPLDALPEGTTGATRRRLTEIIQGVGAATEW
ncbi:NUDIX domain-containing protein [Bosea sp. 124]|uniref:NUDIX domain-containing protein n=1 Tax=Bosea sp. 124 TaxID=2135642 RepID=UPI000D35E948|nr:NUDIX domain-containing protein [Bosea sp. 124]